jgi:hypothetical protein
MQHAHLLRHERYMGRVQGEMNDRLVYAVALVEKTE